MGKDCVKQEIVEIDRIISGLISLILNAHAHKPNNHIFPVGIDMYQTYVFATVFDAFHYLLHCNCKIINSLLFIYDYKFANPNIRHHGQSTNYL